MKSELHRIKTEVALLRQVLNAPGNHVTNHSPCPFCGSGTALSVRMGESGAFYRCHSCAARGDVVTALSVLQKIKPREAILRLTGESWKPTTQARPRRVELFEPVTPKINKARATRLLLAAHENIIDGSANKWLLKRRIRGEWIERTPILGFIQSASIAGWRTALENAWTIRVVTPDGECVAVKIHRECPTDVVPKSQWLPFGTEPAESPRHGFSTLWPPPEWNRTDPLLICEGELKAARALSGGLSACSPTTGASFRWMDGTKERLRGRAVLIVFDDDKAGKEFRESAERALCNVASSIRSVTVGENK